MAGAAGWVSCCAAARKKDTDGERGDRVTNLLWKKAQELDKQQLAGGGAGSGSGSAGVAGGSAGADLPARDSSHGPQRACSCGKKCICAHLERIERRAAGMRQVQAAKDAQDEADKRVRKQAALAAAASSGCCAAGTRKAN